MFKYSIAALFVVFAVFSSIAQEPAHGKHWTLTESETLWRGRYGNCDYGFFVALPSGFVGHGSFPPAPNHGFYVALPDAGRTEPVSKEQRRDVWVDAHYDMTDENRLAAAVREEFTISREVHPRFRLNYRQGARLNGVPGVRVQMGDGAEIEEMVIALRGGIIYSVKLNTDKLHYSEDHRAFLKLLRGFQFTSLPAGACNND